MSKKLYTEDQVQALIAAAYITCTDNFPRSKGIWNGRQIHSIIETRMPEHAQSKLREMLLEVAEKAMPYKWHTMGRSLEELVGARNAIVNEVLGETS